MRDCEYLYGGVGAIVLGILFFLMLGKERRRISLSSRLPLTPCGSCAEGMVQVAGRAVGTTSVTSPLLGLTCLMSSSKVEVFRENQSKDNWQEILKEEKSVPFFVEDSSGRVWVDPAEATLDLLADVEYSTADRWKPTAQQREFLTSLRWTAEGLEARLRDFYFQHLCSDSGLSSLPAWMQQGTSLLQSRVAENDELARKLDLTGAEREAKLSKELARQAQKARLRFSERNLLPGDPVCVIGPAYQKPEGSNWAYPIAVRKIHPTDTFLIGEGGPAEVRSRIRKSARGTLAAAIVFCSLGVWMILDCYFQHGG